MTIPNVTMRWCTKSCKCGWCPEPIEAGTPLVSVFYWNKGDESKRKWNTKFNYHPQCWVDQGLDYLNRNPYVPHSRGRTSVLTEEQRRKRFLLVRRFHALEQRMNNIKVGYPDNVLVETKLTKQMVEIMMEVASLGGVPKSWPGILTRSIGST